MSAWTWVEPFAGAAACALRLVGGRDLVPPVSWMGGKRRLARAILDALGVPEERPARVLLADAGPWGWVWPLLLAPESAARVAAVLRSWADEHPRDLWRRLAAQPPAEDLHERAAQWLWLQARSASGVPIWWDGWRIGAGNGKVPTDRAEVLRWPAHQEQRARWEKGTPGGRPPQDATNGQRGAVWRASNGAGDEVEAGQKGLGGWSIAKSQGRSSTQAAWQKGDPAAMSGDKALAWRMGDKEGGERGSSQKGTARGQTGGLVDPRTIAARIEAIARAFGGVAWDVHHGSASAVDPRLGRPTWCYLDPPYVGATGYGWGMPRAEVLALALRWQDAGAVVAVSEAEPLELPGWHHLELTREGGKPEWLTLSRAPARLPERQSLLFAADAP